MVDQLNKVLGCSSAIYKKSLLKSNHLKQYLPNFPTQERKFQTRKNPSIIFVT